MPRMSNADVRKSAAIAGTLQVVGALLRGEALDRAEVARICGVRPAAASRRIKLLLQLPGVSLVPRAGKRVLRFSRPTQGAPRKTIATSACLASSLASLFAGTEHEANLRDFVKFLFAQASVPFDTTNLDRKFHFLQRGGDAALPGRDGVLDEVIDAVLRDRKLRFTYVDFSGKRKPHTIEPLAISIHEHQLYVIGRSSGSLELKSFRFCRITRLEVGGKFKYPPREEWDPRAAFADSFGIFRTPSEVHDVELHFGPNWRTYATTHRWHPSQTVRLEEDTVVVQFRLRLCPEFERFVLGFGSDVEVVAPAVLRASVARRLKDALRRYGPPRRPGIVRARASGRGANIEKEAPDSMVSRPNSPAKAKRTGARGASQPRAATRSTS